MQIGKGDHRNIAITYSLSKDVQSNVSSRRIQRQLLETQENNQLNFISIPVLE